MARVFTVRKIKENRAAEVAWRKLASFQDVERTSKKVMESRKIPAKYKPDVKKQMQQMAYTITQAREFFKSSESSGATTRALMAYYGLTALANAEILWKGDGGTSFDKRAAHFNSHGLELSRGLNLWDFAARPAISKNAPLGLFGLWREFATHFPAYGKTTTYQNSGSHWSVRAFTFESHLKEFPLPSTPISLGRCLQLLPGMRDSLELYDRETRLFRARIAETVRRDEQGKPIFHQREYAIHHMNDDLAERLGAAFRFHPNALPEIELVEVGAGLAVLWRPPLDMPSGGFVSPENFQISVDDLFFLSLDDESLNEFGYYYIALYIAGMVTRYHPQLWIKELRDNTEMTVLIDELVDQALARVPLLVASQLEDTIYIYD